MTEIELSSGSLAKTDAIVSNILYRKIVDFINTNLESIKAGFANNQCLTMSCFTTENISPLSPYVRVVLRLECQASIAAGLRNAPDSEKEKVDFDVRYNNSQKYTIYFHIDGLTGGAMYGNIIRKNIKDVTRFTVQDILGFTINSNAGVYHCKDALDVLDLIKDKDIVKDNTFVKVKER